MVLECYEQKSEEAKLFDKQDRLRERIFKLRNDILLISHLDDEYWLKNMHFTENQWIRLFKLEEQGIDKLKEKLSKMVLEDRKLSKEWEEKYYDKST